jgi:hypothetical protein
LIPMNATPASASRIRKTRVRCERREDKAGTG